MVYADLELLKLEAFIRLRNEGKIVWTTKDGDIIPIKKLSDEHLTNIIHILKKRENDYDEAMEALASTGDIEF